MTTDLIDPELAHNDVVHGRGDFPPNVMISAGVELQMNGT